MACRVVQDRFGLSWIVAGVILFISVGEAFAQQAKAPGGGEDFDFTPHWRQGEARSYEQTRVQRMTPKGALPTEASNRSRIDVKVVQAGQKGYLLSWTIVENSAQGERVAEQQADLAETLNLAKGWTVLLELDPSGNLLGVRNWQELKSRTEALNESILRSPRFRALKPDDQARYRSQLQARLKTKEQVEELCTREAKAFLAPIGLFFKGGQPIQYETELANPRGGKPFPARARFEVSVIDPKTSRAIIDWSQVVQPAAPPSGLGNVVNRLGRSLGRPPKPGENETLHTLSIADECRYLMDMKSGWVNDMKQSRLIRQQDGPTMEESLRIRWIDPSKTEPNPSGSTPKRQSPPGRETR
jgi:hypothetical protein